MWESTDGSCVLLLVSSYSGPGLTPAPVMLGDGGLPVLTSHSLPHRWKLIAGRNFEELGWSSETCGKYDRKQAVPGNVERQPGKKTAVCL